MKNLLYLISFLLFQLFQFIIMFICTALMCWLIPIVPLYLVLLFTTTYSINKLLYRMVCVKSKNFWLCCVIPIFLIYLLTEIVLGVLVQLKVVNALYIFIIVILAINFIVFLISAALSIKRCGHCGISGIGILELKTVEVVSEKTEWEDGGTTTDSVSVTVTDSTGNRYSGKADIGSRTEYKQHIYQTRHITYKCKCCGKIVEVEKNVSYGLLRKYMDIFSKE